MRPRRRQPRSVALAAGLIGLWAAGCVTERLDPPRGTPISPGSSASRPATTSRERPRLPEGPIAKPSAGTRHTSRLRVAITPLGSVPYDGQVLPLVSPDGRFVATQIGTAPPWPTILAQPGAAPPMGLRLSVFDISQPQPTEVAPIEALPDGLLLGRSTDDQGFLVESPRPDGSRWIGRVSWVGSRLSWLVRGSGVHAHATLSHDGTVVYTTRPISGRQTTLAWASTQGVGELPPDAAGPGVSLTHPFFGSDRDVLYAMAVSPSGVEVLAMRFTPRGGVGAVLARRALVTEPDAAAAALATMSLQTPLPAADGPAPVLVLHPGLGRLVEFSAVDASLASMPQESIAGVRCEAVATGGVFVTTADGLMFSPDPASARTMPPTRPPASRVLDVPHVPRRTVNPARPLVLLGPVRSAEPRVTVMSLTAAPPDSGVAPAK